MKVHLIEDFGDGTKNFAILCTKKDVEELEKLKVFRQMNSVEQTIESALEVEIEAMY